MTTAEKATLQRIRGKAHHIKNIGEFRYLVSKLDDEQVSIVHATIEQLLREQGIDPDSVN